MSDRLWATIVAERVAEAWLASDHPDWHGGHEAAREIAGLLREHPTLPQLSATAARMLRTLRDVQCATGEPVRMRMPHSGGHGWISWHAGYVSGPQSLTVRHATFERLHRLKLIEYDKDDPNGGKLYKLTLLGAAALQVYDLNNDSATDNPHKSEPS
jgi:hypothetical protein